MRTPLSAFILLLLSASMVTGCREDELVVPTEYDILPFDVNPSATPAGMYLLNEGNMGSNKASKIGRAHV